VDLSAFTSPRAAVAERDIWDRALTKIRAGEMPPSSVPKPSAESVAAASRWMEQQLVIYDASYKIDPGAVTARRLNRAEYNNTIRDLLGIHIRPADEFPLDDSGYGFDNIGDVLSLSPVLTERYWKAADQVVRAAMEAPPPLKPTLLRIKVRDIGRPETLPLDSGGQPLLVRNALIYPLRVPAEATYDINIMVQGRGHPNVTPPKLAIIVSGKQARIVDVETDEEGVYKPREFSVRQRLGPGVHQIGAAFLKGYEYATVEILGPQHERRNVLSVNAIEVRGPFEAGKASLPATYSKVITCVPAAGDSWSKCARQLLAPLIYRAWRRPVAPKELDRLVELVNSAQLRGETFESGIKTAMKALLLSPNFLFRVERDPASATDGVRFLNAYELASRLSYFLWSSMPDDTLFRSAETGALTNPDTLRSEVRRMIRNEKATGLTDNFAGQWLEFRRLQTLLPDPMQFPDYDVELSQAMQKETALFFEAVLRENRPVTDFIDGRYTFVNERLAQYYGLPDGMGQEFRRVPLDGIRRSGVLTHSSVLTVTSYPNRTSPVLRGLWVLENILGAPPPPPPPNVPELQEKSTSAELSLRQRLEQHRANPTCAGCHKKMDALGFALENFDAVGAWRSHDGPFPVDTAAELPGGHRFSGPAELKALLLKEKDQFTKCLIEKLLTYALGRGLTPQDRPTVAAIAKTVASKNYGFLTLVEEIVLSAPFRQRRTNSNGSSEFANVGKRNRKGS
jgi:hypothetical protein